MAGPNTTEDTPTGNRLIEVRDLEKWFGTVQVLKGVNLDVQEGQRIVVVGPSGSGKSTLVRCIGGLEGYQNGSVTIQGREVGANGTHAASRGRQVGVVFQQYNLFPHLTVLQNLMLAPTVVRGLTSRAARDLAIGYLSRVHIADQADKHPAQLSGGQQQRAAIARALCMEPRVMLFDEPTSALDPEMVQEVLDVITEVAREGMTMVCVTHELRFARQVADKIVFMDDGHVLEASGPEDFFSNPKSDRAREFLRKMMPD